MDESAESVVRRFLDSWVRSDPDELTSFFADDGIYVDGPRAVHHGINEIRTAFTAMAKVVPSTVADVQAMVSDERVVMAERIDRFDIGGMHFTLEAVGVFEIGPDEKISRFHDYYDMKLIEEQIVAAGITVTG